MSCGRKEWRSNSSSIGTRWMVGICTCSCSRPSGLLDLDAQLHRRPSDLRDDAVLLGEGERLLDPGSVLGEKRPRHGGPDHGALEAIAAGRVLAQLSMDLQRQLRMVQVEL